MDRDTLEGDLDLILGPQANAEPVGEWDWEPPLGTAVPADEPEEPETTDEADSEASVDEDDEDDEEDD
jgi:hypothetical protein